MTPSSRITPDRVVLAAALLAAFAYLRDLRYDFILDDVPLILTSDTVTSLRNWKTAFTAHIFSSKYQGALKAEIAAVHYRPVYRLWQMFNAQVFGLVFPWWHLTSLLLHLAVVALVFQVGVKFVKDRWAAAVAAAVFAVHPIHAESVAYVTASTDVLVTLFLLLSLLAYFRFREEGGSPFAYAGAILAACVAMLSKETAVVFPWMLVAYEALRDASPEPADWRDKGWLRFVWTLPFFAVVGAYLAVRSLLFGLNAGQGPGGNRIAALVDVPLVALVYLRNLLWPFRLSFFYPAEWSSHWTFWRAGAVLLASTAAVYLWKRFDAQRILRLQVAWAAILLLPALLGVYAFVREDWVHDRHMYLASVPVCLMVGALLVDRRRPSRVSAVAFVAVLAVLLISLAIQLPRFTDDATIYASALRVAPDSVLARQHYAEGLWTYGRREEGLREFEKVTELAPRSANVHERYGAALAEIGRDDQAHAQYEAALACISGRPEFRAFILSEMTQLELKHSEIADAAAHAREAVELAPATLNYHALLAEALKRQNRQDEAEEALRVEAAIQKGVASAQRGAQD